MKDKLSVIIPTYCTKERDGLARLKLSLSGYLNQTLDSKYYEIKLVDDGSEWDIKSIIEEWNIDLPIEVLRIKHNGMCSAYNFGIVNSNGNYIFLGIDDNIPSPELLEKHFDILVKNKFENLVVVGKEYTLPPNKLSNINENIINFHEILQNCFIKSRYIDIEKTLTDPQLIKSNLIWLAIRVGNHSMKRDIINKIHGFDIKFDPTGWYADIELGYRLKQMGVNFKFEEFAKTIHLHHDPLLTTLQEEEKNLKHFYLKHENRDIMLLPVFFDVGTGLSITEYDSFLKKLKRISERE